MSKKMCKRVKEDYLETHLIEYIEHVKNPRYVCKKCGRVADEEELLCKSKKIKE
ncbi:hypothetical protein [Fusibacter sp. 3D3]|uniref:hypothetical protein n=1 Tax=Fusibacter sp. 3D3 TaxID=1048380 RepID=UPI0008565826|nr:hypothetical protein [Fusibacter sp. 3D3]GAU79072.1 hypothetical protein F3D3_3710 [Fusibacter sp. 3D3]